MVDIRLNTVKTVLKAGTERRADVTVVFFFFFFFIFHMYSTCICADWAQAWIQSLGKGVRVLKISCMIV